VSESSTFGAIVERDADESGFKRTRWWWVRHAPVRVDGGRIYGQKDLPCDCSDAPVFAGLARFLPQNAVWVVSNLSRTQQTADAIWAAAAKPAPKFVQEKDFAEQNLGDWQGLDRESFLKGRRQEPDSYWYAAADERAPNGESFVDLVNRVAAAITRLTRENEGRDIVAVAHGGTIRAAIGIALGLPPRGGLAFTIDNCSLTRLDHYRRGDDAGWRVATINQRFGETVTGHVMA
jgi:alpha-ribazole phosphatase